MLRDQDAVQAHIDHRHTGREVLEIARNAARESVSSLHSQSHLCSLTGFESHLFRLDLDGKIGRGHEAHNLEWLVGACRSHQLPVTHAPFANHLEGCGTLWLGGIPGSLEDHHRPILTRGGHPPRPPPRPLESPPSPLYWV